MSQEGMPPEVADILKKQREEQERDPSLIVEDPEVEQDPLFLAVRAMIERGEASRLLKGRGY